MCLVAGCEGGLGDGATPGSESWSRAGAQLPLGMDGVSRLAGSDFSCCLRSWL